VRTTEAILAPLDEKPSNAAAIDLKICANFVQVSYYNRFIKCISTWLPRRSILILITRVWFLAV
jgi:hypothetical protein